MRPRKTGVNLRYNGADATVHISDVMLDFDFTDATEESDSVSITVHDPDGHWSGAWMPQNGDRIEVEIVRENWENSGQEDRFPCGNFIVDSFQLSSPPPRLIIEGVSSPVNQEFKETKRTQTWEKVTIRQVASEIAGRYGLALVYDTAQDVTLEREEQNNQADSTYLKELCNKYGMGLKVYADQLVIWSYDEYEAKEPVMTITPDMLRKWSYKGSIQGTYTGVRVTYTDAGKDETVEAFVGTEGRVLTVNEKAESVADAERIGKNALRNANRKEITMDLTMIPSRMAAASCTVMLEGFGRIDGTYFVQKVSHRISRKDYSLRLSLYRLNEDAEAGEPAEEGNGTDSSGGVAYTVKKGDTLWDLARTFYGDSTKYGLIYRANQSVIESEASRRGRSSSNGGYWIYPGTVLTIPPGG